ncbi:MAG: TerB family tellurite resistance protein [Paracoccaceae bacterium]|jgi:uncharacterized tellurite resistance protein B-like protein|nr:TerB family tellurite resistance protein [Paracoccaceae bacterium]
MFANLLKTLLGPEPKDLTPSDARLAIAALLVRVARSDNDYAAAEIEKIDRVLATRYDLAPAQSVELRKQGEELEKEAPDTVRFTRAIKNAVLYADRLSVIEALWQIALADGERDFQEDALLRLAANLLGVSDVESASARRRIAAS